MNITDLPLARYAHAFERLTTSIEKGNSPDDLSKEIDALGSALIVNGLPAMLAIAQAGSGKRKQLTVDVANWLCQWLVQECGDLLPDVQPRPWFIVGRIAATERRADVRHLEEEATAYMGSMKMLAKAAKVQYPQKKARAST
ncbi:MULTISPECIES: hypothetical protein [unclassified Bradyrhizobium]|uniref:hypothetical protein n=1 Tax=unclassified Bradyrhizobium TaxID=2631580 RepID=UPI0029166618|nr:MULTISPECIES: hypothetical protein [unclassified Bradyrhizobium]